MDLLDLAVFALRMVLVAMLYGFLLVVLRSAGRSLQAARPGPGVQPSRRRDLRLMVVAAGGSGLSEGQAVDVANGLTLGRSERAAMRVADAGVSAEHARIARAGIDWVVRDLGSTNGTFVNGARVTGQATLHHGDILALGGVQFRVALVGAASGDGRP